MLDQARAFTYQRQRLGRAAPGPAAALADVLAVYSSHPSAPLALAARSTATDPEGFRAAAAAGVRLPAMRGSIHLMPAAAGARAFREAAGRARLKGFGIEPERYVELRALLLTAAETPRTQQELGAALGVEAKELKGATAQMTREGSLARIGADGLRSNILRYEACDLAEEDRDAALGWLAGEYLRTLGPARREDVIWWLGVRKGRADAALAQLDTIALDDGLLLRAEDEACFAAAAAPRGVDLLGKWDPLTMGHAPDGRARCELRPECFDFRGDGLPVVLVDGRALGTWSLTAKGKRLAFLLTPFDGAPSRRVRTAIDARAEELKHLLA
jgi:hypothetical protein